MQNINHKAIRQTALIIVSLALLFCAACAPAPDEVTDVYVEYVPNVQGSIDKAAAEEQAAETRVAEMLEQMENIASATVDIVGSGDPVPVNITLTLAEGAAASAEMEETVKTLVLSAVAGSSDEGVTVTFAGES